MFKSSYFVFDTLSRMDAATPLPPSYLGRLHRLHQGHVPGCTHLDAPVGRAQRGCLEETQGKGRAVGETVSRGWAVNSLIEVTKKTRCTGVHILRGVICLTA